MKTRIFLFGSAAAASLLFSAAVAAYAQESTEPLPSGGGTMVQPPPPAPTNAPQPAGGGGSTGGMMPPPPQGEELMQPPQSGGGGSGEFHQPQNQPPGGFQGSFQKQQSGSNFRQKAPSGGKPNTREGQQFQNGGGNQFRGGERQRMKMQSMPSSNRQQFSPQEMQNEDESAGDQSDEEQKQMQEGQLRHIKQGIRSMERGILYFKKSIDRLTAKGVPVPSEYQTLVTDLMNAVDTIKNATEMGDDVESAMETIQDKSQDLQEIGQKLNMLEQWPKMIKQAEREVKKIESQLARLKKKATAEQEELIAKIETHVSAANEKVNGAKTLADGGDVEAAAETLHDGVFAEIEDAREGISALQQIANVAKMVRTIDRELTKLEKQSKRFAAKKKDVTALNGFISEGRSKLDELKALVKNPDVQPDDLFEIMSAFETLKHEAATEVDSLNGKSNTGEFQFNQQSRGFSNAEAAIGKALEAAGKK